MTFVYADPNNTLHRHAQPLSRGDMRHGELRPIEGPEGVYTLLGHALTGAWTGLGTIEGSFEEACEMMDIHAETSTAPYNDFRIEMRVIQ